MIALKLGFKLLLRDWKSGELSILFSALLIGVISTTSINFFTERVRLAMLGSSSEVLGGDLLVSNNTQLPQSWLEEAQGKGLETSSSVVFSTMASFNGEFKLSAVKAVDESYPLRGELRLSNDSDEQVSHVGAPEAGTAWVDKRLMNALKLGLGDRLEVGDIELELVRLIVLETDRGSGFYDIQPRLMMNVTDLPAANIIQPGSRVEYRQAIAGDLNAIDAFNVWLQPRLTTHHELVSAKEGRPSVRNSMVRAEKFLNVASFIAVLLASVAIAIATAQYAKKHFDTTALLRCFGASEKEVLSIFIMQLLLLGFIASCLGSLIGYSAQLGVVKLLDGILPQALPSASALPIVLGFATAFCMLLGFALPPIVNLRKVTPLRALKSDVEPSGVSAWLLYSVALLFLITLLIAYTKAVILSLLILVGGLIGFSVFALLSVFFFTLAEKLTQHSRFIVRNSIKNLRRHSGLTISQIAAFGLTFLAIALIALIRTDLITSWQQQLPEQAPNNFAINISPQQVPEFERFLAGNGVENAAIYPMTRGRLLQINDVSVHKAVTKEDRRQESTQRELNMTWSHTMQPENRLMAGKWWADIPDTSQRQVSVEAELAQKLGIKLNDELGFTIAGSEFTARVTSLREVSWESFRPNFYMIFRPGDLNDYAVTYMTGFYLPDSQAQLAEQIIEEFPGVTLFEVDVLLQQVRDILTQVTLAIESIFLIVLVSGVVVLLASVQASLSERIHEGAIWRTIGASRAEIRNMQIMEFFIIGLLAGLLATLSLEAISFLLYTVVFSLDYSPKWFLWPITLGVTTFVIVLAGTLATARVGKTSPLILLRDQ